MAEITADEIKRYAEQVIAEFADGFQFSDIFKVIPLIMEIVERIGGLTSEEKKQTVIKIVDYILDETDGPGPDVIIDPLLKRVVPYVIELVVSVSKGKFGINRTE